MFDADISRSIVAGLDRNRSRWQSDYHSKVHAESLAATIQNLSLTHQDALLDLQKKYSQQSTYSESLSGKLNEASSEIQNMHDAFRDSQGKLDRYENENKKLEELLIQERSDVQNKLNDRNRELNEEREVKLLMLT